MEFNTKIVVLNIILNQLRILTLNETLSKNFYLIFDGVNTYEVSGADNIISIDLYGPV